MPQDDHVQEAPGLGNGAWAAIHDGVSALSLVRIFLSSVFPICNHIESIACVKGEKCFNILTWTDRRSLHHAVNSSAAGFSFR